MDFQTVAVLFQASPITASVLFLVLLVTGASVCVVAYVAARALHDMFREKREERLRDAALAQRLQAS